MRSPSLRRETSLSRAVKTAVARLDDALDPFMELGMPFEAGEVRLRLARVFAASGSDLAVEEARHALATFERLGAAQKADAAAAYTRWS